MKSNWKHLLRVEEYVTAILRGKLLNLYPILWLFRSKGKKKSINTSPSSPLNLALLESKEFLMANVQGIQISGSLTALSTRSVATEIVINSPTVNFIHRTGLITEQVE